MTDLHVTPLDALRDLVASLREFSQYGACCYVIDPHSVSGACGAPAHVIEWRPSGGRLFYCDEHVEQRPDPLPIQQLPHAPALRQAQRVLKEAGGG
jgi:hypothetical protein